MLRGEIPRGPTPSATFGVLKQIESKTGASGHPLGAPDFYLGISLPGGICSTVEQIIGRGRPATEYWLTLEQATAVKSQR